MRVVEATPESFGLLNGCFARQRLKVHFMAILGVVLSPSQHCVVLVLRGNPFDAFHCCRLLKIIDLHIQWGKVIEEIHWQRAVIKLRSRGA